MSCQNCSALQTKIDELEKRLKSMEVTKKDESVILEVIVSEDGAKVTADPMLLESSFV